MANVRGSYPHPVLDESDDVLSSFEIDGNPRVRSSLHSLEIDIPVILDDPDIHSYLEQGDLGIVVRWHCPATFEMDQVTPDVVQERGNRRLLRTQIDQGRVYGKVRIEVQLVALRSIPEYILSAQNPDYGDAWFNIRRGDLVGHAGEFYVSANKLYDPMRPPISSCFVFESDPDERQAGLRIHSMGEVIRVLMPGATHSRFSMQKNRPRVQTAMVLMPALMAALEELKQSRQAGEVLDYGWARSLSRLIDEQGIDHLDSFEQAQRLLDYPIDAALEEESQSGEAEDDN